MTSQRGSWDLIPEKNWKYWIWLKFSLGKCTLFRSKSPIIGLWMLKNVKKIVTKFWSVIQKLMVAAPFAPRNRFWLGLFWEKGAMRIHFHRKISGAPWVNVLVNLPILRGFCRPFRILFMFLPDFIFNHRDTAHLNSPKIYRGPLG